MKGGVVHGAVLGGIDKSSPPHLIETSRWLSLHNMRPFRGAIQQLPRQVRMYDPSVTSEFLLFAGIPTRQQDRAMTVGLTKSKAYQLRPVAGTKEELLINGATGSFTYDSTYRRWASCMYNNQLWFLNDLNTLYFTDGTQVKSYPNVVLPKARYVESFYDHLVVGNYSLRGEARPNGILSSGLYNPSDWVTASGNEVMRIDFEEFTLPDFPLTGLTGLRRLNNLLVAYLPTAIIGLNYVGLPKVYQWNPIKEGVGNSLPYGLVSNGYSHFFFDGVEGDFFRLDTQGVASVGERVSTYFMEDLSTDVELAAKTWGFVWKEYQEVWWVYCSNASDGEFDKAIGLNWRTGEWYTADVLDVHAFGGLSRRAKTCDELTGTCDALGTVEADTLSDLTETMCPRIWSNGSGEILREKTSADADNLMLGTPAPYLETRDYVYASPDTVCEVDSILLDAAYAGGTVGIEVFVSARRYANDPVVYQSVGVWTPQVEEGRLTFPGKSGIYFRYKFVPKGTFITNVLWTARVDGVYDGKADK
jgi:hypothetical protein